MFPAALFFAFAALAALFSPLASRAQQSAPAPAAQKPVASDADAKFRHAADELASAVPAPNPADVASPAAIVAAAYRSISGPMGPRDWNRFRALCLPDIRIRRTDVGSDARTFVVDWSIDDSIHYASPILEKTDFYECALVNRVERFGNLAHVYSSYASSLTPNGEPFARGINSWQLIFDGKRWWIVSLAWDEERPNQKLPAEMDEHAH